MSKYKMVPVEPTIEMLAELGFNGDRELAVDHADICADLEACYRAMLDAAPEVSVPEIIETVANFVGSQEGGPFTPAVVKAAILGQLEYGDAFTKLFPSPAPQLAEQQPAPEVVGPAMTTNKPRRRDQ